MIILGSTGSIGKNTLEIAERFNLEIETLVAGENYQLLNSYFLFYLQIHMMLLKYFCL